MNTTDTIRCHRVLVLWLDLQQALANSGEPLSTPWNSIDPAVTALWNRITDPTNDRALEEWLFQAADGDSAAWALKALQISRERRATTV